MWGKLKDLVENRNKLSTMKAMRFSFKDRRVQELVIELNRDRQLFDDGVNAFDEVVGYYSAFTEFVSRGLVFRGKQKRRDDPYFFFDSGEMFNSFFIRVDDDAIIIGNTDIEKLEGNKNIDNVADLLGLTDESKEVVQEAILPELREWILRQLLS